MREDPDPGSSRRASTAEHCTSGVARRDFDPVRYQASLDQANADVLVVGHTHQAAVIRVGGGGLIGNHGAPA
jgi:predicted phosphodiesterase